MTTELRSKFIELRGYWIPVKDIADNGPHRITLHDGRVFER